MKKLCLHVIRFLTLGAVFCVAGCKSIDEAGKFFGTVPTNNAPTISEVYPARGAIAGGTRLTVVGTNFLPGTTVEVGGRPCTSPLVSETNVICTTTPHFAGTVDVVLTNYDGQTATLEDSFIYQGPPTISSLSPDHGSATGGTTITLTGTGFVDGATVLIDNGICTSPTVLSDTSMTCVTPSHTTATVDITVTNSDGQAGTLEEAYFYQPAPTVSSVSPASGLLAGGTSVTITGTGFISGASVLIGGNPCSSLTVVSGTSITCVTAAHSPGLVDIEVENYDGQNGTKVGAYTYLSPAPTVTAVSPVAGAVTGATNLTITGTGFLSGASVTVGGSACTSATVNSATQISCTTSPHAAGVVDIVVTNSDAQTGTGSNLYTYQPAPTFSSVSPSGGALGGGTALTITGTGFLAGAAVTVGGNPCTSPSVVSSTSLTCTTAAHAAGAVDIVIANPDSQSVTSGSSYTYRAAPTITSLSPSSGALAGGTQVTITGTGFINGASVTIGGGSCGIILSSSTQIICTTASHAAGVVDTVVVNPDTQGVTASSSFTYRAAPTVTSVSPTAGALAGDTTVVITGTGFLSGAAAQFDAGICTSLTVIDDTSITCHTPPHAAGSVTVLVSNSDGQYGTRSNAYTYQAAPAVVSVSPSAGALAGGTTLTLTGTGFISGATVTVGGNTCTSPSVSSSTSMTCLTAAHAAGAVSIVVTNSDTQSGSLSSGYTYQAAPTISSISPPTGPIAGGATITIAGTNFRSGATVAIDGSSCDDVLLSSTQITCTTPAHALGSVDVTVSNSDSQSATASGGYTYQLAPTITALTPSAGALGGGTAVTITGTNFALGLSVSLGGTACGTTSVSATSIVCNTGAHSAATVDAIVTNADGQVSNTFANAFTYQPAPIVTSVSPIAGALGGGTTITLTGTNFRAGAEVTLDGVDCTSENVVSSTSMTCVTPSHAAGIVDIVVTNSDGQNSTLSSAYTYQAAPTVTSISPSTGFLAGGYTATITGTNFRTAPTVTLAGVTCDNINLVSSTQITCTVAYRATAAVGDVVVTNWDNQPGTLSNGFTYATDAFTRVDTFAGQLRPEGNYNGTGNAARFNPESAHSEITNDGTNLYLADQNNCVIRKAVISTRVVTTFAGTLGDCSDSAGTFTSAKYNRPAGLATDGTYLYIGTYSHVIHRLHLTTGVSEIWAGGVNANAFVDDVGTAARFYYPIHLTTDGTNLYVADHANFRIRQIDLATATVTTIAGDGTQNFKDDTGTAAQFNYTQGILYDSGNLYIVDRDNYRIRKMVLSTGVVSTIAGDGNLGWYDGSALSARFNRPSGIALHNNILYIYSAYNQVRALNLNTNEVSTVAGTLARPGGQDGVGVVARFKSSWADMTYVGGYVYIFDHENYNVRRMDVSNYSVVTVLGAIDAIGFKQGTGTNARFNYTTGVTYLNGQLYVASYGDFSIRQIDAVTSEVSLFSGSQTDNYWIDGKISDSRFNNMWGLTNDGTYIYVADRGYSLIRKIDIASDSVTTIAGLPGVTGAQDGTGQGALLNNPLGLATDGTYVYFGEGGNYAIRKVEIATGVVTTLAGSMTTAGKAEGIGGAARFNIIIDLVIDPTHQYLYAVDYHNSVIWKVVIATGEATIWAGGTAGYQNGIGTNAQFNGPHNLTSDGTYFYVMDWGNRAIRKINISTAEVTTINGPNTATSEQNDVDGTLTDTRFKNIGCMQWTPRGLFFTGTHGVRRFW